MRWLFIFLAVLILPGAGKLFLLIFSALMMMYSFAASMAALVSPPPAGRKESTHA
ncbi:MAG: hypothetical protein KatS3mg005_2057 [Bryobacteraceae bacterium]|nr:MAG: hypothetical protein KatS3mg005_2057 [Bryobacteraceae bacterium]